MAITLNGDTGITTPTYGGAVAAEYIAPVTSFKNRIINGAMQIDQRNAGASVTPVGSSYTLDRWGVGITVGSKFSVQQNAGSVTPPAGFINYLGVTSLSAYSILASDIFVLRQIIEGFNIADFGWGTGNAQAVTVSFWVRSSLTGTFGGSAQNSASNRSYPFSYTISATNTWEYKTVIIPGDTTGTWLAGNDRGLLLSFSLGTGSTFSGTAGAWAGSDFRSATGATSVVGTNGATFYITGVQLEKGSNATSFDYRPYGTELALCQRYLPAVSGNGNTLGFGIGYSTTSTYCTVPFLVTPRVAPTGIFVSSPSHFNVTDTVAVSLAASAITFINSGTSSAILSGTISSGVTVTRPTTIASTSASANLLFTGCEL